MARSPRLCQRLEIDPRVFRSDPLRGPRSAIRRARAAASRIRSRFRALLVGIGCRARLANERRRIRPIAALQHHVHLALAAARSDEERLRFSVGRVVALRPVDGDVYEAQATLLSKRSGGKLERCFLVRIQRGGCRRLLRRPPRVVVLGRQQTGRLAPLGRLAPGTSVWVGRQTLRLLGPAVPATRHGFASARDA